MRSRSLASLLILSTTAACYDRRAVRPDELRWLDGYDVHHERQIEGTVTRWDPDLIVPVTVTTSATLASKRVLDVQGNPIDFTSSHELTLKLADQRVQGGQFQSIEVDGAEFRGVLRTGGEVRAKLADVQEVEVSKLDGRATAALWVVPLCIVIGVAVALARPWQHAEETQVRWVQ